MSDEENRENPGPSSSIGKEVFGGLGWMIPLIISGLVIIFLLRVGLEFIDRSAPRFGRDLEHMMRNPESMCILIGAIIVIYAFFMKKK